MTKSEQSWQKLNEMGVRVFPCPGLEGRRAICSPDGFVGLAAMETSAEEHTVLEHERMHFVLNAFYQADAPLSDRLKLEGMVNRATILSLVPRTLLESLLRQGLTAEEAAEELNVTLSFLLEAYDFYKQSDPAFCSGQG